MQIIKPQRIAILYKAYEHLGQFRLAVTAAIYFPFAQPRYLLPEVAMWKRLAEELKDAPFDLCMPKPRGEVLLLGKCFAPGGQAVARASVGFTLGDPQQPVLQKRLDVYGDRLWQRRPTGLGIGTPTPFVVMPIDYAHAFGGPDFAENPSGKGAAPLPPGPDGSIEHPLPNVEDPKHPIFSPNDRPAPAGFAGLDFSWPQRARKAGTYDQRWLRERFPAYADDMDSAIFNAAPPDQWLPGHFRGDEVFSVSGMHPERAVVAGSLPGVALRCLVERREGDALVARDVAMRADTLWLIPEHERAILVFRGDTALTTDDASDVAHLLLAAEEAGAPRSFDYYREVLTQRLDPRRGALLALRDDQLLPPQPARSFPFADDSGADDWIYTPKGHQRQRLRVKMAADLARAKADLCQVRERIVETQRKLATPGEFPVDAGKAAEIAAAGAALALQLADVDRMLAIELPPEEAPATLEELPELKERLQAQARQAQLQAEADIAAAEKRMRESFAATNAAIERGTHQSAAAEGAALKPPPRLDYDEALAAARQAAGGPPKPFAERIIGQMRQAQRSVDAAGSQVAALAAAGPGQAAPLPTLVGDLDKVATKLREAESMQAELYRRSAQLMMPAPPMSAAASAAAREQVLAAVAAKRSLAGVDLTGADLSGLDLRGIDLRDALLEYADFSGSDLGAAELSGAVLVRARFTRAKLQGAKLVGANLGFAELGEADASAADLSRATLANARCAKTRLCDARLDGADLLGARLGGADLSRVSAPEANFINVDLSRPETLPAFDAEPPPPAELDLRGASFAGANLSKARFINCIVEGIDFAGANLDGAVFVGARGDRCSFRAAKLDNVRMVANCSFAECDFSGARLDRGNLRGCRLQRGDFSGCSAIGTDFSEAQLARSRFGRARARGARFAKADLSLAEMEGIDLMDAILQKAILHGTRLAGANLFGADLLRIKVDAGTDLSRANLQRTLAGAVERK